MSWEPLELRSPPYTERAPPMSGLTARLGAPAASNGRTVMPVTYQRAGRVVAWHMGVVEGSEMSTTSLPGSRAINGSMALLETADGFRAFLTADGGPVLTWRSADGLAWETTEAQRFVTPIIAVSSHRVYGARGGLRIRADGDALSWVADGPDSWAPLDPRVDAWLDSGTVDVDFGTSRVSVAGPDGAWTDVPVPGLGQRDDMRTAKAEAVGRALFIWVESWDPPRPRTMWVLELQ